MMMRRTTRYLVLALVVVLGMVLGACTPKQFPAAKTASPAADVAYLSAAALEGRFPGTRGDSLAAQYIRDKMQAAGLRLLYGEGFQPFTLVSSVTLGDSNLMTVNGKELKASTDFLPYSFSSLVPFSGEVVFAGYGFDIRHDSLTWNDYAGVDVRGKWVLLLKGDPEADQSESIFEAYSGERAKVLTAMDHGAAGVLFTGGPAYNEQDQLQDLYYDKNSSSYPVPVFQVTRAVAEVMLASSGKGVAALEEELNHTRRPVSLVTGGRVTACADVHPATVVTRNVAALLPGSDERLREEYIVVGAHYDHLGWGGAGSGSRTPDTAAVHYGADDNASGVAAVLEIARLAASGKPPRRSVVFAAFGAEEMGLVGSRTFTENPPIDLKKTTAMFNFDMVGRLDTLTKALSISGTQTATESEEMLRRLNTGFDLAFSGEGFGPSDHASFYMLDIPVFFFSTGAHADYHTPADSFDKINSAGISSVAQYAWQVISEVANREEMLAFREAGAKVKRSRHGRFKVTLGVMPDFAGLEKNGLRVDAVTGGKPADLGGMHKGDIITAIDGKPVGNIYDYMNRLKEFSAGQTISVDVLRNGEHKVLIIQL